MISVELFNDDENELFDRYKRQCIELLNQEWPRSVASREASLQQTCSSLPLVLALKDENDQIVAQVKLSRINENEKYLLIENGELLMCRRRKF